jgi:hypothetical protein
MASYPRVLQHENRKSLGALVGGTITMGKGIISGVLLAIAWLMSGLCFLGSWSSRDWIISL